MRKPVVPEEFRDRPFTFREARAAGLSDSALRSSPWRQVFQGVWIHADLQDTRDVRLAAAKWGRVYAVITEGNVPSQELFARLGFTRLPM